MLGRDLPTPASIVEEQILRFVFVALIVEEQILWFIFVPLIV